MAISRDACFVPRSIRVCASSADADIALNIVICTNDQTLRKRRAACAPPDLSFHLQTHLCLATASPAAGLSRSRTFLAQSTGPKVHPRGTMLLAPWNPMPLKPETLE